MAKATRVSPEELEQLDEEMSESLTFDLNDPQVLALQAPEVDAEAVIKFEKPQPPPDGDHLLVLRLRGDKEGGPVYVKADRDPKTGKPYNARLIAAIEVRIVKDDGTEGQFLKDYYPTTNVMAGQKASGISSLCVLAGKPCKGTTFSEIKGHVENLFADAGDEGVRVWGRTRWVQSVAKVDPETGMPEFVGDKQQYDEYKGQARITKMNQTMAELEAQSYEPLEGETDEEFEARKKDRIEFSTSNPHAFLDPVDLITWRYAQAEVAELIKPPARKS